MYDDQRYEWTLQHYNRDKACGIEDSRSIHHLILSTPMIGATFRMRARGCIAQNNVKVKGGDRATKEQGQGHFVQIHISVFRSRAISF